MRQLFRLFLRSILVSAVTVGGGYVILSVLRREYAVRRRLISDGDMTDIAVIAQTAPGAVAVNASLLVGYRLCGIPGALASVLGTLIPPVAVMSLLSIAEQAARGIPVLSGLMLGMRAGAAAVILDTALDLTKSALSRAPEKSGTKPGVSPFRAAVFVLSLLLCLFTELSSVWILLFAAIAGATSALPSLFAKRMKASLPNGRTDP